MANIRAPFSVNPVEKPPSNHSHGVPVRNDLLVPPQTERPEDRTLIKMRLRRLYILRMIRAYGTISRAEIGRRCSYNPQSTKRIVDELVGEGLVVEEGKIAKPVGRSPIACRLNESAALLCGLHLHGDRLDVLFMDLSGEVRFQGGRTMAPGQATASRAASVTEAVMDLYREAAIPGEPPLVGFGLGVEIGDPIDGADFLRMPIMWGPTIGGVISEQVSREFDLTTLVSTPVRMRAFASLWFGIGQRYSSFVYVHLGERLEIAHVVRGRVQAGAMGRAGHLDNLIPNSGRCAMDLFQKPAADSEALWGAVGAVINLLNPTGIIITTDRGPAQQPEIEKLRMGLRQHVPEEVLVRTPTVPCDLPDNGALLGAAACVLHHIFSLNYVSVEDVL